MDPGGGEDGIFSFFALRKKMKAPLSKGLELFLLEVNMPFTTRCKNITGCCHRIIAPDIKEETSLQSDLAPKSTEHI